MRSRACARFCDIMMIGACSAARHDSTRFRKTYGNGSNAAPENSALSPVQMALTSQAPTTYGPNRRCARPCRRGAARRSRSWRARCRCCGSRRDPWRCDSRPPSRLAQLAALTPKARISSAMRADAGHTAHTSDVVRLGRGRQVLAHDLPVLFGPTRCCTSAQPPAEAVIGRGRGGVGYRVVAARAHALDPCGPCPRAGPAPRRASPREPRDTAATVARSHVRLPPPVCRVSPSSCRSGPPAEVGSVSATCRSCST